MNWANDVPLLQYGVELPDKDVSKHSRELRGIHYYEIREVFKPPRPFLQLDVRPDVGERSITSLEEQHR